MSDYSNRRQYLRTPSDAMVQISHPGFGTFTVSAHDLSDGGIAVNMGNHICPPIGTIVDVIIKRHTGAINADPVKMEIRHVQVSGIAGLKFV